jgi:hypothetical protein
MAAAEITPTFVLRVNTPSSIESGSAGSRIIKYLVKLTKVTQADWFLGTLCPGTFIWAYGVTIDGSGDGTSEACTYTATGTKVILPGAGTGTSYIWVTTLR